jgi:thiol-disulfide isomerase/thioredoxin
MPSPRQCSQRLAIVLALISACRKAEPIPDGDIAASLAIETVEDKVFDPTTLRGKPTLVLFASPSCPHCISELPIAQRAAAAENANLVAVFVVGAKKHAASVARTSGFTAPVLVDDGTLRKKYDVKKVPWTVVLRPDGRAEAAFTGETDEATLRDALDDAR